jgi:hypothetical protein
MITSANTEVKGLCFPYNIEETNLNAYFPKLPDKFPPNYICNIQKGDDFSKVLDARREARVRDEGQINNNIGHQISPSSTWRMKEICTDNQFDAQHVRRAEVLQLGGRGDMFYGYAQNIDVESELKKINHKDDKCFYDNYKIKPENPNSALHKHQNIIRKDYLHTQKNTYLDPQLNPMTCLKGTSISTITPYESLDNRYQPVSTPFNNNYITDSVPQKLWHNMTKRRMIYRGCN